MLRLRRGRWYTLTLRDGSVVVLEAHNRFPGRDLWQLLGERKTYLGDEQPCHLIVKADGSF
jgi:hypothetical protein